MNLNFNQQEFCDFVEKLTECETSKTFSWVKKWLIIQNHDFYFFNKRPANESEISQPTEIFHYEKASVKCFNEYKTFHLKNKKNFVCVVSSASSSSFSGANLIFSVKSEKRLNSLSELFDSNLAKKNFSKKILTTINTAQERSNINAMNILTGKNKSSSDKKENMNVKPDEAIKAKDKQNFLIPKSNNYETNYQKIKEKGNKIKNAKHKKNYSCGYYETSLQTETECSKQKDPLNEKGSKIISIEEANHNRFKSTHSFTVMGKEKTCDDFNKTCTNLIEQKVKGFNNKSKVPNRDNYLSKFKSYENSPKRHITGQNKLEEIPALNRRKRKLSCEIINSNTNLRIDENVPDYASSESISSLEKINPLIPKNTSIPQNEENSSLSKIINNMLISSKKVYKFKQRVTDSFIYLEGQEKDGYDCSQISSNRTKFKSDKENSVKFNESVIKSRSLKRKQQLNKIIKLSHPKQDSSQQYENNQVSFNFNRLNLNQSFFHNEAGEGSAGLNINISQEEISFDEKEKENDSKGTRLNQLIQRIENLEDYIFDPYSLKKLLKSYNMKKKDIGLIYNQLSSNKSYLKTQLLTEMISIISKKFLKQNIITSLEIVLKEKQINKNYFVNSSNQHSIEFCIVDIFNTFLGSNKESEEFYIKILPNYLVETFSINFQLNLKNQISIPNLFVLMEYHNRVYFNDNLNINFSESHPFVMQDIRYISPYQINKWFKVASDSIAGNGYLNTNSQISDNVAGGTTNVKRMKYNNFEMRDSFEKMLQQLKETERNLEEQRISLVKNIYFHIFNKRIELALKLCDFYFQKYADTIFLNPIIYLILCEIYSDISGINLARLIFQKAINILNWQFPVEINPLLINLNYTFSLILMKHNMNLIDCDSFLNNENVYLQSQQEILELLEKSKTLSEKFYDCENEKRIKIILQINLVKLSNCEFLPDKCDLNNSLSLKSCLEEILTSIEILHKKELYREEAIYLNIFSDIINSSSYVEDEIKIIFLQRLHEVKKIIKINGKS